MENLEIGQNVSSKHTIASRENYARTALILFHPYRKLQNLLISDEFWEKFYTELQHKKEGKIKKFWDSGFKILQNIQDRISLEQSKERASDFITKQTLLSPDFPSTRRTHLKKNNLPDITDLLTMT